MINFHIITLFPETFDSYLKESIISRAIESGKIKVNFYNIRDFTKEKHRRVDGKPYSGGPGMVIMAEPVVKAVEKARGKKKNVLIILLSPSGKKFNGKYAEKLSKKYKHIIIISGRYEGIDARVKKIFKAEELSVGDFVLTGGEIPAMAIIDSVSRFIPGVLGNIDSLEDSRISSPEVYTRPESLKYKGKKYKVPEVLLSGDHKKINEWKSKKREV